MALQASGEIRMSQINTELGRVSNVQVSLDSAENGTYATINTNSASYPSSTNPASMSEWYSYNHSAISGLTVVDGTLAQPVRFSPCSLSKTILYFHDGTNALPVIGDTVYTNSGGTTKAAAGRYGFGFNDTTLNSVGIVISNALCP